MRFLIIEDEEPVADLLVQALSRGTDETVSTGYLREAIAILEQDQNFDAILLNLTLPLSQSDRSKVADGTTYQAIKDVAPSICRVIASGGIDENVVRQAGADGCTYLLKTEINCLTLRDTIGHAIEKFQAFHVARSSINSA